jgi:hypothetical protein
MSDDDDHVIHGPIAEVIRKIMEEVTSGRMSEAQATELMMGLNHQISHHRHDVSTPYRVALIAQGYEWIALELGEVHMTLTRAGALFEYGIRPTYDADFMEKLDEAGKHAMLQASVWTLRGGNINASIAEDGTINLDGNIRDYAAETETTDVEALVTEFVKELNEEFPDQPPPPRKGTWW